MGPDSKRILLATALSMAILLGWQFFIAPKQQPKPTAPTAQTQPAPAAPSQPAAAAPAPSSSSAAMPADAPEETVVLESPEFKATFTSHGGALKSLVLKSAKFQRDDKERGSVPVDLVHAAPGEPLPLAVALGPELGGPAAPAEDPAARAPLRIASKDDKSVTFEGQVGPVFLKKRFSLTGRPYEIGADVEARADRPGSILVLYSGYAPPQQQSGNKCALFTGGEVVETVAPMCRANGKTERFHGDAATKTIAGTPRWVGLDQHYFVSALVPQTEAGECVFSRGPTAGTASVALKLPVNGSAAARFQVYAGPKQNDLLVAYGRELETAIDYGAVANFFSFFAKILLWVMRWFHSVVGNWGVAIILLTLLVKAVLYPLTAKSMQSMNEMRKLQPEIEKLKARYGDDREKMNLAVMQLYQQHKVNPLGGCLPLLLQMPVFFALYATLGTSVELYREPFLWIRDLTHYDPYYVLPLAMGVSQFIMQKLSPQPADNAQAKMLLYFMPAFFTLIMFKLPAGLALYIFANNLISMAQQQWLLRRNAAPPAMKAA